MNEELITMKCSKNYKEKIRSMAKERGMNISEFIRHLVAKEEKK